LHPRVRKLKDGVSALDIITAKLEDYLEEVVIPEGGYVLNPGQVLFGETLEIVSIPPARHIGQIKGRHKVSSYGIDIIFSNDKVPAGLTWNVPLCLKNNLNVPVHIPAFFRVAQLMFISYPFARPYKKTGGYREKQFPGIETDEMTAMTGDYKKMAREVCYGSTVGDYDYSTNIKKVKEEMQSETKRIRWYSKFATAIANYYPVIDAIRMLMLLGFVKVFFDMQIHDAAKWAYALGLLVLVIIEQRRKNRE
jgi:deoxycytidine triphosphate deaminase